MALLAETQNQFEKALELFTSSFKCSEASLGADHQYTIDAKRAVDRVRGKTA